MSEATNTGNIQDKTVAVVEDANKVTGDTLQQNQESVDQNDKSAEKTFTQEELNNIIKKRLEKFSDYEQLLEYKNNSEAEKLSEVEKLQKQISELQPYKEQVETANGILEKLLESELSLIAEDKRSLIPDNFTTSQKLEYITNNKQFLTNSKSNIKTPGQEQTTRSGDNNLIYGKWASIKEFAEKDPKHFGRVFDKPEFQKELERLGLL